jgi:FhaA, N-terminal domain/FHA domain
VADEGEAPDVGVFDRFERRLESLVNKPFAKAFHDEVQPVEIAAALQRECDDKSAIVGRGRTMVPNRFTVELSDHDHERLAMWFEPLAAELASMVREHAESQHYSFVGPVEVEFARSADLDTGLFEVASEAVAGVVDQSLPAAPAPGPASDPGPDLGSLAAAAAAAAVGKPPPPPAPERAPAPSAAPIAFPPDPDRPVPALSVGGQTFPLTKPVTVIGRGTDVDLRVDDPGASRRHCQIVLGTTPSVVDLGSTNGTLVDGYRVESAALLDGATITIGTTTLLFRTG